MRLMLVAIALATLALDWTRAWAATPSFNYIVHCQGCHLVDGRETPGKIPALVGAGRFLSVTGGREFLMRVPGVSLSVLDDAELAELLNWMLYRFSTEDMPADFEPYTAEEVASYRRNPLVDVETVRHKLVAAFE
jgi:mono/diheme cytochrome c family protein